MAIIVAIYNLQEDRLEFSVERGNLQSMCALFNLQLTIGNGLVRFERVQTEPVRNRIV